jgi:exosome complex RNA-binding protein Csl4
MTSIQDINSAIISGAFTNDQLNSIVTAVKFARNQITRQNTGSLVIGSKVKFTSTRNGQTVLGTVEKVNRKYIIVREQGTLHGTWRVPANMLSAA